MDSWIYSRLLLASRALWSRKWTVKVVYPCWMGCNFPVSISQVITVKILADLFFRTCAASFSGLDRLTQEKETACMQTNGSATFCYSFPVASAPFELLFLLGTRVKSCPSYTHLLFPRQTSTNALCWPCHGLSLGAFSFSVFLLPLSWTQLGVHCLCCPSLLCFTANAVLWTSVVLMQGAPVSVPAKLCSRRWELSSSFWMRVQPEGN